jgi:cytochrome c
MKNFLILASIILITIACGSKESPNSSSTPPAKKEKADNGKGIGEIKNVALNNPLDPTMVSRGKAIYDMKCSACHKLTPNRVVGPGFKGVTDRRKPEWIMNMVTNVEVMLDKDPTAQKLLEECLTRMPNQNLSIGDARDILEFLYSNDTAAN